MNIKAKFIGQDGSLGYRKGKVYLLTLEEANWIQRVMGHPLVTITGGGSRCPYSNWGTFLQNWIILRGKS